MTYYALEPEVAGGWGRNTVCTRKPGHAVVVHKLHYEFDGWLGDHLLATSPGFVASEQLADEIEVAALTGVAFADVEVTTSQQFYALHPGRRRPPFRWMKVTGVSGQDDFGIGPGLRLIVSGRALAVLRRVGIAHAASVTPLTP